MWLFYVPVPKGAGKEIARKILGVCKCVNIYESKSVYKWKGEIKEEEEEVMVIKTANPKELEAKIKAIHPYEVPAIIKVKAEVNDDYQKGLKA